MPLSTLFGRFRTRKPDPAITASIKARVLKQLGTPDGVTLTINEINCNDPGCPGVETVILIMEPNRKTRACKITRKLEDIDDEDIAKALLLAE